MTERRKFIDDYLTGEFTVTELGGRDGISRKTGHKWIRRFMDHCELGDRSSRPHHSPRAVPAWIEDAIVRARRQKPKWGPRKLRDALRRANPGAELPSVSTFALIFRRNGLIRPKRRKRRTPPFSAPLAHAKAPAPRSLRQASVACPSFRPGGGCSQFDTSGSNPASRSRMADTNGCTSLSHRRPPPRRRRISRHSSARSTASARSTTATDHTKHSVAMCRPTTTSDQRDRYRSRAGDGRFAIPTTTTSHPSRGSATCNGTAAPRF